MTREEQVAWLVQERRNLHGARRWTHDVIAQGRIDRQIAHTNKQIEDLGMEVSNSLQPMTNPRLYVTSFDYSDV